MRRLGPRGFPSEGLPGDHGRWDAQQYAQRLYGRLVDLKAVFQVFPLLRRALLMLVEAAADGGREQGFLAEQVLLLAALIIPKNGRAGGGIPAGDLRLLDRNLDASEGQEVFPPASGAT